MLKGSQFSRPELLSFLASICDLPLFLFLKSLVCPFDELGIVFNKLANTLYNVMPLQSRILDV